MNHTHFDLSTFALKTFVISIIPVATVLFMIVACCCCWSICSCCTKSKRSKKTYVKNFSKKWSDKSNLLIKEATYKPVNLLNQFDHKIRIINNNDIELQLDPISRMQNSDMQKSETQTPEQPLNKLALVYHIDNQTSIQNIKKFVNTVLVQKIPIGKVIIHMESPGGEATKFGEIHSQFERIRLAGIELVACADRMAASGGYMAICCANHIMCSSCAIIGSIGAMSTQPNFTKILENVGILITNFTTGKDKLSYDPFSEHTQEQCDKVNDKLGQTHKLFKRCVKKYRKNVDTHAIKDGGYWYGKEAKKLGLVDEICLCDEYLLKISRTHHICLYQDKKNKGFMGRALSFISSSSLSYLKKSL